MADLYTELLETANELIDAFGRDVNVEVKVKTVPDTNKPWETVVSDTLVSVRAVEIDQSMVNGDKTPLPTNKLRLLVKAAAEIKLGDTLLDVDDVRWSIESIFPLRPGSIVLLNEVVLKR